MSSMEHRKPSIKFIHSFYSRERNLFYRMATSLEIDGDLALKIISFWLWLEENINTGVIHSIESLSDDGLKRICLLGEQILTNATKSDCSIAQKTISGVDYFLKTVCTKAVEDLREKKEHEKAKKTLQELDLQEFLCKSDPSNLKSYLSGGDGVGYSSSIGTGMHMQWNNDCTQNLSRLSATAKAYIPSYISHATNLPIRIHKSNFTTPLMEHMTKSSGIVPLSAQTDGTPHLSALHMQDGAIKPNFPTSPLQSGEIVPCFPPLVPNSDMDIIPHLQVLTSPTDLFVQHMSALTPQNGAILPQSHTSLALQNGVIYIPTLSRRNNMLVQQLHAFSPQDGAIVPHVPIISSQSGTIAPQNDTNLFHTPSATNMIINTQNIPQPTLALVPPRRLHPDERTLFVTFSNGSPLTEEELLEFFAVRYNVDVESIFIEEPNATRTPQYAHVTFFNQESVEYVLNGQAKVKFRTNGKHLWARRFIPRRKRRWGQNSH